MVMFFCVHTLLDKHRRSKMSAVTVAYRYQTVILLHQNFSGWILLRNTSRLTILEDSRIVACLERVLSLRAALFTDNFVEFAALIDVVTRNGMNG